MERRFLLFVLSFTFAALFSDVHGRDGTRIRGGSDALSGEFPYQVSLEIGGQSFCGGSIISEWIVVSAAHCFITKGSFQNYPVKVVAGIHKLRTAQSTRQEAEVDKVYIPSTYVTGGGRRAHPLGDISVLKLKQPLNLNRYVTALRLPEPYGTDYAGKKAVISGFGLNHVDVHKDALTGKVEERNGRTSGKLRFAETNVIDQNACTRMYGNYIDDSLVCAQVVQHDSKNPEGVCSGDSGGPLVYNRNTLIGTVSTSPIGCVENVRPGIYTRVSSWLDFINKAQNDDIDRTILRFTLKTSPSRPVYGGSFVPTTTTTTHRAPVTVVKKIFRPSGSGFFWDYGTNTPTTHYQIPSWMLNF